MYKLSFKKKASLVSLGVFCALPLLAQELSSPQVNLIATVNGVSVPATIRVGTVVDVAPQAYELEYGKTFTFYVDYVDPADNSRYSRTYPITANWTGMKTEAVALDQVWDQIREMRAIIEQKMWEESLQPRRFSVGAGMRAGMKLRDVSGGLFSEGATGGVGAPMPGTSITRDWWVKSGDQIEPTGDTTGAPEFYPICQMTYWGVATGSDGSASAMPGLTMSYARDFVYWKNVTLGVNVSLSGFFGLSAESSRRAGEYTHLFDDTASGDGGPTVADSWKRNRGVEVNPTGVSGEVSSRLRVTGTMFQLGVGPEFVIHGGEESWLLLYLTPSLLFNYASIKTDVNDPRVGSTSSTDNKFIVGAGISATAAMDLTEAWTLGLTLGYEYLPTISIGSGVTAELDLSAVVMRGSLIYNF